MYRRFTPDERGAHLGAADGHVSPVGRYAPSTEMADSVRWFWVPVWSLPAGRTTVQRVLAYPVVNVVVERDADVVMGPQSGLTTKELSGDGWAVAAMLHPASGATLLGGPVGDLTDGARRVDDVPALTGLPDRIRGHIGDDPGDEERVQAALAALEQALAFLAPVDEEGQLVNAIVEYVERDPEVRRVGQICAKFDLSERRLQRLAARRIGLSPKWLIQRRRLHEAADRLATAGPDGAAPDLARVAADLGYADQSHFTRDFRTVTGLTPGEYAGEPRG